MAARDTASDEKLEKDTLDDRRVEALEKQPTRPGEDSDGDVSLNVTLIQLSTTP